MTGKMILYIPLLFFSCSNNDIQNSQKLLDDILPINSTVFYIIEKYGNPDKIDEIEYKYDPDGKVIKLYYSENIFHFYIDILGNSFPQDWVIINNFELYSNLLNTNSLNVKNVKKIFGNGYNEISWDSSNKTIYYRTKDSVLSFIFKNDMLIKIDWSADR
jgi:hypothetical protein